MQDSIYKTIHLITIREIANGSKKMICILLLQGKNQHKQCINQIQRDMHKGQITCTIDNRDG